VPIDDRDYVAAWRSGGSRSVEALLNSRCPTADARIRELELLECLGNWEILWRRNATSRKLAGGKIKSYLSDRQTCDEGARNAAATRG
jgi:hypothetical protein